MGLQMRQADYTVSLFPHHPLKLRLQWMTPIHDLLRWPAVSQFLFQVMAKPCMWYVQYHMNLGCTFPLGPCPTVG